MKKTGKRNISRKKLRKPRVKGLRKCTKKIVIESQIPWMGGDMNDTSN